MENKFNVALKPLLMSLFILVWTVKISSTPKTSILDNKRKTEDTIKTSDEKFLIAAAESSLDEIMFSQLAQQNSAMTEVKDLAKTIGSTHINQLNKTKEFASKNQVIVPSVLNEQTNKAYKKLGNKSGSDFDKEYTDWLVTNYKETVALYEKTAEESSDVEIKSWTTMALPELRTLLEQAIQCQKKCNKM